MRAEIGYGRDWWESLSRLEARDARQVNDAMRMFCEDPATPGLNLEQLHGDRRLHTIRATRELRLLLAKEGSVYVFLEAGHHDDLYALVGRRRFIANPATGFVGLIPIVVDDGPAERAVQPPNHWRTSAELAVDVVGVLDHWSDAELAAAGFGETEIALLRACKAEDDLCQLVLPEERLMLAIDLLETTPERWKDPHLDDAREAEQAMRTALLGSPESFSKLLSPEEAAAIATAPIETWMVFLHPDQRHAVTRQYAGPSRIRGSAGTGKTVVALHRAGELARRYEHEGPGGRVLFTTFIKNLPPVFDGLFRRMPGALPDRVDFLNIDKLAFQVCQESGDRPKLEPRMIDAAFAVAYRTVVPPGTPLAELTREYLRTEVTAVIKGRGLRTVDEYIAIERTGRRIRFTEAMRRQLWALREEWDRQMASRGTMDFADVVLRARDHARRRPTPTYRAAIVDEAQDLTLVGLQLLRALTNGPGSDQPDGLMIVGDGAQRIYAGGFTLRQAGIDVRGRTSVLRVNYRNTRQIIDAAMAVAGGQVINDLGDEQRRDEAQTRAVRSGVKPMLKLCTSPVDELRFVVEEIGQITSGGAIGTGDIAIAVTTNDQVRTTRASLESAGLTAVALESYEGRPTAEIKVGTHHRIKGLEFKVVFLPFLGRDDFPRPRPTGQTDVEYEEEGELAVARLFVAMTRARDGLYVTCTGEPSAVIEPALASFELL